MESKIVILGSGLSGMISALSLASYGYSITILENKDTNSKDFLHDIRTTALNANSKDFLEKIQVWSRIHKHVGNIDDIYVVDNKSNDMLHFSPQKTKHKKRMGYLIDNHSLKKELLALVRANKLINLVDQVEYQIIDEGASARVKNSKGGDIITELLLVCNSHMSQATKQNFSAKIDKMYGQEAITFTIRHEKPHESCAVEHFLPSGPFAILPLKDQYKSSIVWTVDSDLKNALLEMDPQEFLYNLKQNIGSFLGEIEVVDKLVAFPLKAYLSSKFVKNRIILLADSAHIIHPLAGQGLNQGIQDIASLISNIISYGVTENSLRQYESARMKDNMIMYGITDNLNRVFSNRSRCLLSMRQIAFKAIEKISPLKALFVSYAMGDK
ncbi:MAG: hypothetical protein DGJ47_000454 [Rickettsiaceae bacterium]